MGLLELRSSPFRYQRSVCKCTKNKELCEIYDKSDDERPYLSFTVSGVHINALYDSGAQMCVLSTDTFDKLRQSIDTSQVRCVGPSENGNAATGDVMKMLGKYEFECEVGNRKVNQEFYVAENFCGEAIVGIDMIHALNLMYDPQTRAIYFADTGTPANPLCSVSQETTIAPRSAKMVSLVVGNGLHRVLNASCVSLELKPRNQNVAPDDLLVKTDEHGKCQVYMFNRGVVPVVLARGEIVGRAQEEDPREVKSVKEIMQINEGKKKKKPMTPEQQAFIEENLQLNHLPEPLRQQYKQLVLEFYDIISYSEHDFGETTVLEHEIPLLDKTPCYQKQFPIPEMHRQEVIRQVTEWLRLGVIERTHSEYNSAVFAVPKKLANGEKGLRIVLDYRQVNAKSVPANYRLPMIQESLDELGRVKPEVFSQLDLRSGFHNVYVKKEDRPVTAFHVPNMGQFQWVRAPFGLRNTPLTFQRLMDIVFRDMVPAKLLLYIDDLLCKASSHDEMLQTLHECFTRLRKAGLKLNLQKCNLGVKECVYLGFKLTPDGYAPNETKVEAITSVKPPRTLKEIRTFLGMTNFFRNSIKNYARISQHLSRLTCRDSGWARGPLPKRALEAFKELQRRLCTAPILAYPKQGLTYHLYVDASLGTVEDTTERGGLGAMLCQDQDGVRRVIAYASRGLEKHERNYTPFLLELQAINWGIDHFMTYLTGVKFVVHTDHKPLTKLGKVHTRTLNRLQQLLLNYDFELEYCQGEKNPSDYLSRTAPEVMTLSKDKLVASWLTPERIEELQHQDTLCSILRAYVEGTLGNIPDGMKSTVTRYGERCEIRDNLLVIIKDGAPLVIAPGIIQADILAACHGHLLTGHGKAYKTVNRVLQMWWWPGLAADADQYVKDCVSCQRSKGKLFHSNTFLQPHEQPKAPFERCHVDLFGPLRTNGEGKKYIMVLTDAYTKFARFVAIRNKEPETVAEAIFNEWICQYGCMAILVSDRGTEFISRLNQELYTLLKIDKRATSPLHPQANSAAEVINKSIISYLRSMLDNDVLEWEKLLKPMELAYNTGTSKATKTSPFYMLYGVEPRTPMMDTTLMNRVRYGDTYAQEVVRRLQLVRKIAMENNLEYKKMYQEQHDQKVKKVDFKRGQLVWLYRPDLPTVNVKLTCCWEGPYAIIEVTESNVLIVHVKSGKTRFVHQDRVKLYRGSEDEAATAAKADERRNEDLEEDIERIGRQQAEERPEPSTICMPELVIDADVTLASDPDLPPPLPKPLPKQETGEIQELPEVPVPISVKAEPASPAVQDALQSEISTADATAHSRGQQQTAGKPSFFRNLRAFPAPTPIDLAGSLFAPRTTRAARQERGDPPLPNDVLSDYPRLRRPASKRRKPWDGDEEM